MNHSLQPQWHGQICSVPNLLAKHDPIPRLDYDVSLRPDDNNILSVCFAQSRISPCELIQTKSCMPPNIVAHISIYAAYSSLQMMHQHGRSKWPLRGGMLKPVQHVLRLKPGGLLHAGPPCSSWVWLNRGTSKRSDTNPEGNTKERTVLQANTNLISKSELRWSSWDSCVWSWIQNSEKHYLIWIDVIFPLLRITARTVILLIIALARCCFFCVEQPRSSLMQKFVLFRGLRKALWELFGIQWQSVNLWGAQIAQIGSNP